MNRIHTGYPGAQTVVSDIESPVIEVPSSLCYSASADIARIGRPRKCTSRKYIRFTYISVHI